MQRVHWWSLLKHVRLQTDCAAAKTEWIPCQVVGMGLGCAMVFDYAKYWRSDVERPHNSIIGNGWSRAAVAEHIIQLILYLFVKRMLIESDFISYHNRIKLILYRNRVFHQDALMFALAVNKTKCFSISCCQHK